MQIASIKPTMYAAAIVPYKLPSPPRMTTMKDLIKGSLPIVGVMKRTDPRITPATDANAADNPKVNA